MARGARATVYALGAHAERAPEAAEVRILASQAALAELGQLRRRTYEERGIVPGDDALEAQRRCGVTLGLYVRGALVGGLSAWRLSEALCSLGYMLAGVGVETYAPERVVEFGGLFVVPEHQRRGHAVQLLAAARILVAGMRPDLAVAFATRGAADLYVERCGFRVVGPFVPHPLTPSVEVVPLVATADELAGANFL